MSKLAVAVSAEDHVQGVPEAKVTLVEYGDYQCPHCKIADSVVKRLQRHFGKGLRFVFRNFPLEMHPMAEPAAEAAEFAATKGKFWEMHDAIFKNQQRLDIPLLVSLAEDAGLDGEAAKSAITEQVAAKKIGKEMKGGEKAGVHGTPTFFINGAQYTGAWEYEELVQAIDAA